MSATTLISILDDRSQERPDKFLLRFRDEDYCYADFAGRTREYAAGLHKRGINRGEVLPTLLPNCGDAITLWFALSRLAAVWAPINTEFRGQGLAHAINLTRAETIVVDTQFLPIVEEISDILDHVRHVIVRGDPGDTDLSYETSALADLPSDSALPEVKPDLSEPCLLLYTSGTTGVSKACELSHRYVVGQSDLITASQHMREDDVMFCPFPIFHWDATIGTVMAALRLGATAVITERFSVSKFWVDIRHFGATIFDFMGATLAFIYKQPPQADDADNPARLGWGVPMPEFQKDFERRFDLRLVEGYGSTELGVFVFQRTDEQHPPGSCGRPVDDYQLRIVDDEFNELPPGGIGEIVARPDDPLVMMTGYYNMPEANAGIFTDGWFHTGDLGRIDEAGNLYFEGRKKDAIRRRGENISAFEIEQVIEGHPAVLEVAAYGVPSEHTEEDVAVAVIARKGTDLSVAELLEFCLGRMARYMVPLYITLHENLPKTPTEKVAKKELKEWHLKNKPAPLGDP